MKKIFACLLILCLISAIICACAKDSGVATDTSDTSVTDTTPATDPVDNGDNGDNGGNNAGDNGDNGGNNAGDNGDNGEGSNGIEDEFNKLPEVEDPRVSNYY